MNNVVLAEFIVITIAYVMTFLFLGGISIVIKSKIPYYFGVVIGVIGIVYSINLKNDINNSLSTLPNNSPLKPILVKADSIQNTDIAVSVLFTIFMLYMALKSDKPSNSNTMSGGKRKTS